MTIELTKEPTITQTDLEMAHQAMADGWDACAITNKIGSTKRDCDCNLSVTDGCKARAKAIARMIAAARQL